MGLFGRTPGVDPASVSERLAAGRELLVVDVRHAVEWRRGHIDGALHVPLTELRGRLHELPRGRTIVTVCRSGHRSALAARSLRRAGFEVENLDGGMIAWARAGLPVEKPGSPTA
jgi:rhodanese-related sulfurtransferase